jgi:hypothetical protein
MTGRIAVALSLWAIACSAQTTVNGGRVFTGIVKSSGASATVDFSGAASTLPVETGLSAGRPATCTVGQMYFATDAAAGQNLSYCTGTPGTWTTVAASLATTVVETNQSNAYTAGTQDFSGAGHTLPSKTGITALMPSTCTAGEEYFATDATAGQNQYYCTAANTWTQQSGGSSVVSPFSSLHSGFTPFFNPEPSVSGTVSYTDYSSYAGTVSKGTGLASYTEPVSISRVVLTIPTAFTVAAGAPSITALQLSVGTSSNPTFYLAPVQVGYTITSASCSGGLATFTLSSPVPPASQTATVAVSGVVSASGSYNQTSTATWTSNTTFTQNLTCPGAYTSGGMAAQQGLIVASAPIVPAALSGSDTMYLWLTVVNSNPANFNASAGGLTGGSAKVIFGGVQLQ